MAKQTTIKPGPTSPKRSAARSARACQQTATALGVPEFLVRLVGWERLRAASSRETIQRHCD
jgi:hypothetical protein